MAPGTNPILDGAIQTLVALAMSTGFLLALFVGFLVIAGFTKFRKIGPRSLVVRNLADRMGGEHIHYLSPDAVSGKTDQLRTPELLEQQDKPS